MGTSARKRVTAIQKVKSYRTGTQQPLFKTRAIIGNGGGVVQCPYRPAGWVFARINGLADEVTEVWNGTSLELYEGLGVDLEYVDEFGLQSYYQVRGLSATFYIVNPIPGSGGGSGGTVKKHGHTHEWGDRGFTGGDAVNINTRALSPLRAHSVAPASMMVYVDAGFFMMAGTLHNWAGGLSPTFGTPLILGEARFDLLYFNESGVLAIAEGEPAQAAAPEFPDALPAGALPIAFIYTTVGKTQIKEVDIIDARILWTVSDSAVDFDVIMTDGDFEVMVDAEGNVMTS